jgi:hypothetical protein
MGRNNPRALARLPRYAKVGACHLMHSSMRRSAPSTIAQRHVPARRARLRNMGATAGQKPATRSTGCLVCGGWKDEMIALVDHGAVVCRPCVTRVGRAILTMSPPIVARLWPATPPAREARRSAPAPSADVDVEKVLASFKAGVEKHISDADAVTHLDLAHAYGEMGLMGDAIREGATALREGAPLPVASRALNWIFSPGRARSDALGAVARILQSE